MRIGHTELFVSDPLASRDFYTGVLGFELVAEQGPPEGPPRYIWLSCGEREILLRPASESRPAPAATYQQAHSAIVLYTDALEECLATLRARGLALNGEDSGCPCFTDPDGHWWQIVNPGEEH
ncbi:VOC family protein [bacterium]|nr:VOC family protein [bacterium]